MCGGGVIITITIINFAFCFDASSMYSYVECERTMFIVVHVSYIDSELRRRVQAQRKAHNDLNA